MTAAFKIQLHQKCTEIVASRIFELTNVLKDIQEAANSESKSSAGDKYETGREMALLESEKIDVQLTEANKQMGILKKINSELETKTIAMGSLIETNNGTFYMAVGLGKIELKKQSIFVISPFSPIGKMLLTKKEKISFSFNTINYVVENVV